MHAFPLPHTSHVSELRKKNLAKKKRNKTKNTLNTLFTAYGERNKKKQQKIVHNSTCKCVTFIMCQINKYINPTRIFALMLVNIDTDLFLFFSLLLAKQNRKKIVFYLAHSEKWLKQLNALRNCRIIFTSTSSRGSKYTRKYIRISDWMFCALFSFVQFVLPFRCMSWWWIQCQTPQGNPYGATLSQCLTISYQLAKSSQLSQITQN